MYDLELCFTKQSDGSVNQAITASTASAENINFGTKGQFFKPAYLHFRVTETFTSGASDTLSVAYQTDDNESFSSAASQTLLTTIAKASLVAGYHKSFPINMQSHEQYARMYFTASGTFTAGEVLCYINDSPEL